MRSERNTKADASLLLAIALTKKIAELEDHKESPLESPLSLPDPRLVRVLGQIESPSPLQFEDYDYIASVLENLSLDYRSLVCEDVTEIAHFLKAVWMSLVSVDWRREGIAAIIERIGKFAVKFMADFLKALTDGATRLAYPKEVVPVERHFLKLYELLTSLNKYSKKASESTEAIKKPSLHTNRLLKLLAKVQKEEVDKLLVGSSEASPTEFAPFKALEQSPEGVFVIPAEQLRVMKALQRTAETTFHLPEIWVNFYLTTLDLRAFEGSPQWTSEKLKDGWSSLNTCILALELFFYSEGIAPLKDHLARAFLLWAEKALSSLLRSSNKETAEVIGQLFGEYMFKTFLFLSYLSKGAPSIAVQSISLATEFLLGFLKKNFSDKRIVEHALSGLYFPIAFVSKHLPTVLSKSQKEGLLNYNYLLIGVKLFLYFLRTIPMVAELKEQGNKNTALQGAVDSLEELTTIISGLIGGKGEIGYANQCICPEFVETLLEAIEAQSCLEKTNARKLIGKLIIEITQKDACYNLDSWRTFIKVMCVRYGDSGKEMSGHVLAFLWKLSLCCNNKLSQGVYDEGTNQKLLEIWPEILPVLFNQIEKVKAPAYLKILGVLLLLQTILKQDREVLLNKAFLSAVAVAGNQSALTDAYLRIYSLLTADTVVPKICSNILLSILVHRNVPENPPELISKADVTKGMHLLQNLCRTDKMLELSSFISLEHAELQKTVVEKLLSDPKSYPFAQETKYRSVNYYLQDCLKILRNLIQQGKPQELPYLNTNLQELAKYYTTFEYNGTKSLSELAYFNAVIEMYISSLKYILVDTSNVSAEDVINFLTEIAGKVLENIDSLFGLYFSAALAENHNEMQPFMPLFKNLFWIYGDSIKTLEVFGILGLDLSHLRQVHDESIASLINGNLGKSSTCYFNQYQWAANVLETHLASFTGCHSGSLLHVIEKCVLSHVQVLFTLLPLCINLYSAMSVSTKKGFQQKLITIFMKIGAVPLPKGLYEKLYEAITNLLPETKYDIKKISDTVKCLLGLSRIYDSLKHSITLEESTEIKGKTTTLFLQKWNELFEQTELAANPELMQYATKIAGYTSCELLKEFCSLLAVCQLSIAPEIAEILIKRLDNKISEVQEELEKIGPKRVEELFAIKDTQYKVYSLFGKVAPGHSQLQTMVFDTVLRKVVTGEVSDEIHFKESLLLLEKVIENNKERFLRNFITAIGPLVASCEGKQRQGTLISYLSWLCYNDQTVIYPKKCKNDIVQEIMKESIEGYGVNEYHIQGSALDTNTACTYVRTKKNEERQPIYHCYTCHLVDRKGCCSVCAQTCHKGHSVVYSHTGPFYCSCSLGGTCRAFHKGFAHSRNEIGDLYFLRRHHLISPGQSPSRRSYRGILRDRRWSGRDLLDLDNEDYFVLEPNISDARMSNLEERPLEDAPEIPLEIMSVSESMEFKESEQNEESKAPLEPSSPLQELPLPLPKVESELVVKYGKLPVIGEWVWPILESLLERLLIPTLSVPNLLQPQEKPPKVSPLAKIRSGLALGTTKFDIKVGLYEYNCQGSIYKSRHILDDDSPSILGSYLRRFPCASSIISCNSKGILAILESDHIDFFRLSQSYSFEDKRKLSQTDKAQMPFRPFSIKFNPENDSHLVVSGIRECMVLTIDPMKGRLVSRLSVDLMLQALGEGLSIANVKWLPKSQTFIAIAAHIFIKIYDLSKDNISPVFTITSAFGLIKDFEIIKEKEKGEYRFVTYCNENVIGNIVIDMKAEQTGVVEIADVLTYTEPLQDFLEESKVTCIFYSVSAEALFFAFESGKLAFGLTDPLNRTLKNVTSVSLKEDIRFFRGLREIVYKDDALWLLGLFHFPSMGAIILKFSESTVQLQKLGGRVPDAIVGQDQKCITLMESNTIGICTSAEWEHQLTSPQLIGEAIPSALKSDVLPHKVTTPVNYFEKVMNVANNEEFSKSVLIYSNAFPKDFIKAGHQQALLKGTAAYTLKSTTSISITLKDSNLAFAGVRILVDQATNFSVKALNREVEASANIPLLEIPFCQAETLLLKNSSLDFCVEPKGELKLKGIEVYVLYKVNAAQLAKLEQTLLSRASGKLLSLSQYAEFADTHLIAPKNWGKRAELLQKAIPEDKAIQALVFGLDFLAFSGHSDFSIPEGKARAALETLQKYMYVDIEIRSQIVRSSVRKAAKGLIYNLTKGMVKTYYEEYKANALFEYVEKLIKEAKARFVPLAECVKGLSKVVGTLPKQFELWIKERPEIVQALGVQLLKAITREVEKEDPKNVKQIIENYVEILSVGHGKCSSFMEYLTHENEVIKVSMFEALIKQITVREKMNTEMMKDVDEDPDSVGNEFQVWVLETAVAKFDSSLNVSRLNAVIILLVEAVQRHLTIAHNNSLQGNCYAMDYLCKFLAVELPKLCVTNSQHTKVLFLLLLALYRYLGVHMSLNNSEKLLPSLLKTEGKFVYWLVVSLENLYALIKPKYVLDQLFLSDAGETGNLLKESKDEPMTCWEPFFSKEEINARTCWDNLQEKVLKQLLLVCHTMLLLFSEDIPTYFPKELIEKLKEISCDILVSPGFPEPVTTCAQELLEFILKSKENLVEYKDHYEYRKSLACLKELHKDESEIYKCLSRVWSLACERPMIWKKFVQGTVNETCTTLFKAARVSNQKLAFYAIGSVCLALEAEGTLNVKRSYELSLTGYNISKSYLFWSKGPGNMTDVITYSESVLALGVLYVRENILNPSSTEIRVAAAHFLKGLWESGDLKQRDVVLSVVLEKLSCDIYQLGSASYQLVCFLLYLLKALGNTHTEFTEKILSAIIQAAYKATSIMRTHENGHIYHFITRMLGERSKARNEKGFMYCLEKTPCGICMEGSQKESLVKKFIDLGAEVKYTETSHIIKLASSQMIQKVFLHTYRAKSRYIKAVNIYTTQAKTADFTELKKNYGLWKKVGTMVPKKPENSSTAIEFPIPLVTSVIMLEFIPERLEKGTEDFELINCPSCGLKTSALSVACISCGESLRECPKCRSINTGDLNAFICTGCGVCKSQGFEVTLSVKEGKVVEKINNEKEKQALQSELSSTMKQAMEVYEEIGTNRNKIAGIISSTPVKTAEGQGIEVCEIYINLCIPKYLELVKLLKGIHLMKAELLDYSGQTAAIGGTGPCENCYGCAEAYIEMFLKFIEAIDNRSVGEILRENYVASLMIDQILSVVPSELAKKLVTCFVATAQWEKSFEEVIFGKVENAIRSLKKKDSTTMQVEMPREELVLTVELLLRLHSKCLKNVIIGENLVEQAQLLSKATSGIKALLVAGTGKIKTSLQCAEEVVQSILGYATDLLNLPLADSLVLKGETLLQILNIPQSPFEWEKVEKVDRTSLELDLLNTWLSECLLHKDCKRLRETTEYFVEALFRVLPGTISLTTNGMLKRLKEILMNDKEYTENFMGILKVAIFKGNSEAKLWAISEILRNCDHELDRLLSLQTKLTQSTFIGQELWVGRNLQKAYEIVKVLTTTIKPPTEMVRLIIEGCVKVRKLLILSNSYIERAKCLLDLIFASFRTDHTYPIKPIILACLEILRENERDEIAVEYLYTELYHLVVPEKKEPSYSVILRKAISQDMYIRGNMSRSPHNVAEIGKLMSDIRAKIGRDLGMSESQELLELLVADQIIGLNLPIKLVYEKVWWPYIFRKKNPECDEVPKLDTVPQSELEPMLVIYRLTGVDGEATENRVETLVEQKAPEDPEKVYVLAEVFAENGLDTMLMQLKRIGSLEKEGGVAEKIVKLLGIAAQTKQCRKRIAELKGVDILAAKLIEFLPTYEKEEVETINILIKIVTDIISEATITYTKDNGENRAYVEKIINRLNNLSAKFTHKESGNKYLSALTHILPYFAYGKPDATECLLEYFRTWIKPETLELLQNGPAKTQFTFHLARISDILNSVPPHDPLIKDGLLNCGLVTNLLEYLKRTVWPTDEEDQEEALTKKNYSIQKCFNILLKLCKDHGNTQRAILTSGMVESLYRLQMAKFSSPIANEIPIAAETIIEELGKSDKPCKECYDFVHQLIKKTKEENRIKANRKKAEVLRQLKAKASLVHMSPIMSTTNSEELKCLVCNEGYRLKPNEILGAYVYTLQTPIRGNDNFMEPYTSTMGFSTVTHFNIIHLSCHLNAVRAEGVMEHPRREWDGATLRNSYTKCNNWFPICGGSVSIERYNETVNRYFMNMRHIYKTDAPRFRIVGHDLKCLLHKFAYEESFSHHSQGGGPLHNIQFIPYLVQLGLHLLGSNDAGYSGKIVEKIVGSFCQKGEELVKAWKGKEAGLIKEKMQEEDKKEEEVRPELTADDLTYICALALISYSYPSWTTLKTKLIPIAIAIAIEMVDKGVVTKKRYKKSGNKSIDLSESSKISENTVLARVVHEVRPLLILFCIVEEMKKSQQTDLLGNFEQTDLLPTLFNKLCSEHQKVLEGVAKIHKVYEEKMLEYKTVKEFLDYLKVPEEAMEMLTALQHE